MLRSLKDLRSYTIAARDDTIGRVKDFYFDEDFLTVRYIVVDTGTWLPGRKVLIPTPLAGEPSTWLSGKLPVALSREQVELSPGIEVDEPVSRKRERELQAHYHQEMYWVEPMDPSAAHGEILSHMASADARSDDDNASEGEDTHLRSTRTVEGYSISTRDGAIGHVEDFIAEVDSWIIRYMIVDTRRWLPGRKVLVAPAWIGSIDWAERTVDVDLPREAIENGPEFDPSQPVNRAYEERLYDFYGRPTYWG